MSELRAHFERRATELADVSTLDVVEDENAVRLRLVPNRPDAVGVLLYFVKGVNAHNAQSGTVSFDDQASAPAELGEDFDEDIRAIDAFIAEAREGRVTAFHIGHGGCTEVRDDNGRVFRSWMNCLPFPGRRHRGMRIDYMPYG